jgi:SAM-dependent methyltransferase
VRSSNFAAGAASLFVELALVRYMPSEIRVLGYFTNFVLFAAFLGLGTGMMLGGRSERARALAAYAPLFLVVVVGAAAAGRELHVVPSGEEFLFLEYQRAGFEVALFAFLAVTFVVLAASLVPNGIHVGLALAGEQPMDRYAWNIVGSLAGIGLFVVLSFTGAPPWAWMGAAGALGCVPAFASLPGVVRPSLLVRSLAVTCALATAGIVAASQADAVWSPYQKVTVAPLHLHPELGVVQEWRLPRLTDEQRAGVTTVDESVGFVVRVNDDSYQHPIDLSDASIAARPALRRMRDQYDASFRIRRRIGDVLIVGAGTGNDVAAALRAGATRVDAVEIDPEILALGRRHPERPYSDPRVHVHLDDARSYLANTDQRFDQIVFGLLDSHILLSHGVNVRIDSYVFTREAFETARARLAPRGVLVVSHAVGQPWFVQRMRATLTAAFGSPPFDVSGALANPLGIIYASGEPLPPGPAAEAGVEPLEDDWPFVYAESRSIPTDYLLSILLVSLASIVFVRGAAGPGVRGFSLHFFALGAGFLLIETRGLAVLALLVGSTWLVTSAVFASVLVMALGSTLLVRELARRGRSIDVRWAFAALLALLALGYLVPVAAFSSLPLLPRAVAGGALLAAPLFASGIVYAQSIAREGAADRAAASNLLGALAGGLAEYLSMITGFRALVLLAVLFYLVALLTLDLGSKAPGATAATPPP